MAIDFSKWHWLEIPQPERVELGQIWDTNEYCAEHGKINPDAPEREFLVLVTEDLGKLGDYETFRVVPLIPLQPEMAETENPVAWDLYDFINHVEGEEIILNWRDYAMRHPDRIKLYDIVNFVVSASLLPDHGKIWTEIPVEECADLDEVFAAMPYDLSRPTVGQCLGKYLGMVSNSTLQQVRASELLLNPFSETLYNSIWRRIYERVVEKSAYLSGPIHQLL